MLRVEKESKFIFIVGLPRTGTKLMKNVIEHNPYLKCHISHENFFLGHQLPSLLRPGVRHYIKRIGNMSVNGNVEKLIDLMYSGILTGTYWDLLRKGRLNIDKRHFLNEILRTDRSDKAIYEVIMKVHSVNKETKVFGDRTPSHLFHLPILMDWFPDSKIIHTFRDPRAITASQLKRLLERTNKNINSHFSIIKFAYSFFIIIHTTIAWLRSARINEKYQKECPERYYFSKFESIVENPENSIRSLCEFLGIEFHHKMLTPQMVDSSFKTTSNVGIDKNTINRWKDYLAPWMNKIISICLHKYLKSYNYTI